MLHFPIHDLSEAEFETLVLAICRELLGVGVTGFGSGPDGGRDGFFEGTANRFPSDSGPASGTFVIQAKHAQSPIASCSDYDFKKTLLDKELPKVKRLFDAGKLTHYLLFTNRKKTAGADEHFRERVREETGLTNAWLLGLDYINRELRAHMHIVRNAGLDRFQIPLDFSPEDYRDIITGLYAHRDAVNTGFDSAHEFDAPGLPAKNELNGLSPDYSAFIKEHSMPHFDAIARFLKNPRNADLAEKYHVVANELKEQLIVHANQFMNFEHALSAIPGVIQERASELQTAGKRQLLRMMIHYMYVNCEIGRKS
jgi:hypothetical protein